MLLTLLVYAFSFDSKAVDFGYSASVQTFTAPSAGTYKFTLSGAKGADYNSVGGGAGSTVVAKYQLSAGETVRIYTGGMDGTNALGGNYSGGTSSYGRGGGATVITKSNGTVLFVAPGGGSANAYHNGYAGGASAPADLRSIYPPTGEAGAGGGYTRGHTGRIETFDKPLLKFAPPYYPNGNAVYPTDDGVNPDRKDVRNWQFGEYGRTGGYSMNNIVDSSYFDIPGISTFLQTNEQAYREIFSGWIASSGMNNKKSAYIRLNMNTGTPGISPRYFSTPSYDTVGKLHSEYYSSVSFSQSWIEVYGMRANGSTVLLKRHTLSDMLGQPNDTASDGFKVSVGTYCNGTGSHQDRDHTVNHNPGQFCYMFSSYTISGIVPLTEQYTSIAVKARLTTNGQPSVGGYNSGVSLDEFSLENKGYGGGGGTPYSISGSTDYSFTSGNNFGNGKASIELTHTHHYTSSVTTQPTCTAQGVRTYVCTGTATDPGCGDTYTEAIPALGHEKDMTWLFEDNNGIEDGCRYRNCIRFTTCGTRLESQYKVVLEEGIGISSVTGGDGYHTSGGTVSIDATVKTGYTWLNWVGYSTLGDKQTQFTMPSGAVKLTANARPNDYTIDYGKGVTNK